MENKKKYKIIYADPPWRYATSNLQAKIKENRSCNKPDRHYPTMKHKTMVEEISPLIESLADPIGCLAFVWITNKHFPEAIELMGAAGFEWVNVAFVWDKEHTNLGFYTNPSCEFVGLFKKGQPRKSLGKPQDAKVRQHFTAKKSVHSRKPENAREGIERLWPDASRIELFARQEFPGWDAWGNETTKFNEEPTTT